MNLLIRTSIFSFLICPLYFSEFPLYILLVLEEPLKVTWRPINFSKNYFFGKSTNRCNKIHKKITYIICWQVSINFGNEIYKGNSEKYKGQMRNQNISVFGPKHNFVEYIRCLAAFLRS